MEEAAGKTEGVASAVVNFMTQKMIVEFARGRRSQEGHEGRAEGLQESGRPDCEIELRSTRRRASHLHGRRDASLMPYRFRNFVKGAQTHDKKAEKMLIRIIAAVMLAALHLSPSPAGCGWRCIW